MNDNDDRHTVDHGFCVVEYYSGDKLCKKGMAWDHLVISVGGFQMMFDRRRGGADADKMLSMLEASFERGRHMRSKEIRVLLEISDE